MRTTSSSQKTVSLQFVWTLRSSLRAEGDKLWAEGDKLWAEGVIEAYGNVVIEWHSTESCTVEGVRYDARAHL